MWSNSGAKQAPNVVDMDGGMRRLEKWANLHFSFEHHFGRENPGMNYLQEKDIWVIILANLFPYVISVCS